MALQRSKKINNMDDLRESALETLQKLQDGEIELNQAVAVAKLCDSVIGTVKQEIEYQKHLNIAKEIPFLATPDIKTIESDQLTFEERKLNILPAPKK
jgi:hypothetical protein